MHIRTLALIAVIIVGVVIALVLSLWRPEPQAPFAAFVQTYEKQFGPLPVVAVSEEYTAASPELKTSFETYLTESGEQRTVKTQSCRGCHWKCNDSQDH